MPVATLHTGKLLAYITRSSPKASRQISTAGRSVSSVHAPAGFKPETLQTTLGREASRLMFPVQALR